MATRCFGPRLGQFGNITSGKTSSVGRQAMTTCRIPQQRCEKNTGEERDTDGLCGYLRTKICSFEQHFSRVDTAHSIFTPNAAGRPWDSPGA